MMAGCAIGVDLGGTKCAAGLVDLQQGQVLARRRCATRPQRGGEAVLQDVIQLVAELAAEADAQGLTPSAVGVGVPELIGLDGSVLSGATIPWQSVDAAGIISRATDLPAQLEADVRAAARGEATFGAGQGRSSFLYVTVGTGISASFVLNGEPYAGARGLTGTFASARGMMPDDEGRLIAGPPLEQFAAGPALASRFAALANGRECSPSDVIELCESGQAAAALIVRSAGEALGAAIAHLVNVLDPEAVVLGGGLGLVEGVYREAIDRALRTHIYSDPHRNLPLASAALGAESGVVGAALAAADQVNVRAEQLASRRRP